MPSIQTSVHWSTKAGNSIEEYEDAFWPSRPCERRDGELRLAVADGATETSFSREWAQILTKAWCDGEIPDADPLRHGSCISERWRAAINSRPLPWYAEEKVLHGAFAALLGLRVLATSTGTSAYWRAMAIGDTCLFVMRGQTLRAAFPLTTADDFGRSPVLISTRENSNAHVANSCLRRAGRMRPGDKMYLMTDALAHWFLSSPVEVRGLADRWSNGETFLEDVADLRASGTLKNDDVTFVRVDVL